ncbi:MAG: DegT/DnrJ/EryC1/StrS family aminotransferase [Micropepsaceae bacterium]
MADPIPLIDLQAQRLALGPALDGAIAEAVAGGRWILGPQVDELEKQLAEFAGVKHALGCANGTDALLLILRAWGIGAGDAVFVPAFTFVATAEVVSLVGATPVFVDVLEHSFNIDPESLKSAIAMVRADGELKPRAIIPVDLFGQPADYRAIEPIAEAEKLFLLCDTAQGFGGSLDNRRTGSIGHAAATSFFPAKPLGCYGDGGACFTDDDALAEQLRSLRMHGQSAERYQHTLIGLNSRLDTIQAAILIEKLKIFPEEIEARERIARRYNEAFSQGDGIQVPKLIEGARSVWAQYTLQLSNREKLQDDLKDEGIPTAVYYPIPLSRQRAYSHYPSVPIGVSDALSRKVVSLPMHPYLIEATQDRITSAVLKSVSDA